jgi:hypothetical protein
MVTCPGKIPRSNPSIQTFGDFLGFNPHGHVLITDGSFPEKGLFKVAPAVRLNYLEKIFDGPSYGLGEDSTFLIVKFRGKKKIFKVILTNSS